MTSDKRNLLIQKLRVRQTTISDEVADQLKADGVTIATLTAECDAAQAEIARLTAALANAGGALDNIAELNMSGRDENGHRWANSDLIDQEIVWARIAITKGTAI